MRAVPQLFVEELLQCDGLCAFDETAGAGDNGDVADAAVLEGEGHESDCSRDASLRATRGSRPAARPAGMSQARNATASVDRYADLAADPSGPGQIALRD